MTHIQNIAIVTALTCSAGMALGQTAAEVETALLEGCVTDGNDLADCTCIVQNWVSDMREDDLPLAMSAVEMSYQGKPPDPSTMNTVMPLVMGMMDYTLRCAAGELSATGVSERTEIPQTGDTTEEALLLERITTGNGTIAEMMRYDQLVLDRRDDEKQADAQAQAATNARAAQARSELTEAYETELARIHSQPIPDWPIAEFETLFDTYCLKGGESEASCSCSWGVVTELAMSYALPYLASRSEGDDVLERLPPADVYGTIPALSLLNERREKCDGL